MYERLIERRVHEGLADTSVVLIIGTRRADETPTLVQNMDKDDRASLLRLRLSFLVSVFMLYRELAQRGVCKHA